MICAGSSNGRCVPSDLTFPNDCYATRRSRGERPSKQISQMTHPHVWSKASGRRPAQIEEGRRSSSDAVKLVSVGAGDRKDIHRQIFNSGVFLVLHSHFLGDALRRRVLRENDGDQPVKT